MKSCLAPNRGVVMEMINAVFILFVFFGLVGLGIYVVMSAAKRRPGEKYFEDDELDQMKNDPAYNHLAGNVYYMPREIVINPAFKDMSVNIHHDQNE